MKKLSFVIMSLLFLTGCKKEYTCECLSEMDDVLSTRKIKVKPSEAEEECKKPIGYPSQYEVYCRLAK